MSRVALAWLVIGLAVGYLLGTAGNDPRTVRTERESGPSRIAAPLRK